MRETHLWQDEEPIRFVKCAPGERAQISRDKAGLSENGIAASCAKWDLAAGHAIKWERNNNS